MVTAVILDINKAEGIVDLSMKSTLCAAFSSDPMLGKGLEVRVRGDVGLSDGC